MKDQHKTKSQLIDELSILRQQLKKMKPAVLNAAQKEISTNSLEEKFRTLFDLSQDALLIVDGRSGRVLTANQTTTRILGYDKQAIDSLKLTDILNSENRNDIFKLDRLQFYGSVFTQSFIRPDGLKLFLDLTTLFDIKHL